MRSTLSFLLVLAAATPALARDLSVGPGKEYRTIGEAVADSRSGDRIVVASGTYRENVNAATSGLTFVAEKSVVWDGGGTEGLWLPCLAAQGSGIVVRGFRFRAGPVHVQIEGSNAQILNCTSEGAREVGFRVVGYGARIDRCVVRAAGETGVLVEGAHAEVTRNRIRGVGLGGIIVMGDSALARGNSVTSTGDGGIRIEGDDASAVSNVVTGNGGTGISLQGMGAVLRSNRVSHVARAGLAALGDVAVIERNTLSDTVGYGIYAFGDSMSLVGNRISRVVGEIDEGHGMSLTSQTESGGARVERNTVSDAAGVGFFVGAHRAILVADRAVRCGTASQSGFFVLGDEVSLSACVASDGEHAGFEIGGTAASLTRCRSLRNDGDGFRVQGEGATLTDCTATGNATHGIVNLVPGTSLLRGRFLGNGQDVARGGGGEWEAFESPVFATGGKFDVSLYGD